MTEREAIRQAINQAVRAQLEAQGGYSTVERDARRRDRELNADPFAAAHLRRIAELEAENRKLQSRLSKQKQRAEMWRYRALTPKARRGTWHKQAVEMRDKGLSYSEIARRLDVDHTTVIYACTQSVYARKLRSVA